MAAKDQATLHPLPSIVVRYALYAEGKGDIFEADVEELKISDASEITPGDSMQRRF